MRWPRLDLGADACDTRAAALEEQADEQLDSAADLRWQAEHDPFGDRVPLALELIREGNSSVYGFGGRGRNPDEIAQITGLTIEVTRSLFTEHANSTLQTRAIGASLAALSREE